MADNYEEMYKDKQPIMKGTTGINSGAPPPVDEVRLAILYVLEEQNILHEQLQRTYEQLNRAQDNLKAIMDDLMKISKSLEILTSDNYSEENKRERARLIISFRELRNKV